VEGRRSSAELAARPAGLEASATQDPAARAHGTSGATAARLRLALTWLLTSAPLALGWFADVGVDRFAGVSFVALCGIPCVFLAGIPRGAGRAAPWTDEIGGIALLLVPLAAAAGLDAAQGAPSARTFLLFAGVLAAAWLLSDAARRAAADARSARAHAVAWFALVAAPPLLAYALEAGGGPLLGRAPALVGWLARASPLGALSAQVRDVSTSIEVPFGVALVLVIVASAAAWRRPAGGSA